MRLTEILLEKPVESSWITDISYNRKTKILALTLKSGYRYTVHNISRRQFDNWHKAVSKGKHWHTGIKNKYVINRVN